MTWTLIITRPGKEIVYKDYSSWAQATDAMLIAIDKMHEPVSITLTNPTGARIAHIDINPEGVMIGGQFVPFIQDSNMSPNEVKLVTTTTKL